MEKTDFLLWIKLWKTGKLFCLEGLTIRQLCVVVRTCLWITSENKTKKIFFGDEKNARVIRKLLDQNKKHTPERVLFSLNLVVAFMQRLAAVLRKRL